MPPKKSPKPKLFSVAAILRNEAGYVLAVSRKYDHEDLGLIGGKIEPRETAEDAIIREVQEEVGLAVSRHGLRTVFLRPDTEGRLSLTFEILEYKGIPQSKEGAWVGWVEPRRLLEESCSFREYNAALFEKMGIDPEEELEPVIEEPDALPFEEAMESLTGHASYPAGKVTYLYGPTAPQFCPETVLQEAFTFESPSAILFENEAVVGILAGTKPTAFLQIALNYTRSLNVRAVALSPHRPTPEWAEISDNIIECDHHKCGAKLTLKKNLASRDKPTGLVAIVDDSMNDPASHAAL